MKKHPRSLNLGRQPKFRAVLIILALFLTTQAFAAVTYYVDSVGGNDSNSGTSPQTAWKTIGQVNRWSTLQPGDDVLFKRGCTFTDATLNIRRGGTSSDPMVIGAYGQGAKPIIDCGPRSLRGGVLCITPGLGYINVQDLAIRNILYSNESGIAVGADGLTNITISRVDVDNSGNNGIVLIKVNTYIIENCTISNCVNGGIGIIGTTTYPITNGTIRGNVVHDIAQNDGITLHIGMTVADQVGPNHEVSDNVCYNCREQGLDITSGSHLTLLRNETYNNGDSGILVGGCSDVVIEGHNSHSDGVIGIIIGAVQNLRIQNSIIYNAASRQISIGNCSNVQIYHNTIVYGPNSSGTLIDVEGSASNIAFKNNIVASTQFSQPNRYVRYLGGITYASTKSDFSNNIWWRPDNGMANDDRLFYDSSAGLCDFYAWASANNAESGSYFADPRFNQPASADFSIGPTSAAIDAAVDLGTEADFEGNPRPQGAYPDSGAYEYTVTDAVSASAQADPSSGTAPLAVGFTGSAERGRSPYTYRWDFADGQTSTLQSPAHTYAAAGSYRATLTVTDGGGAQDVSSVSITVAAATLPLVASAAGSPTSGPAPLPVNFVGSAEGGELPYSYSWNFGDGQTSTLQSPAHTYADAGSYGATLTVTDNSGAHSSSSVSVAVSAAILPLVASAAGSPVSGPAPLPVNFAGSAQGGVSPYSYRWNFGDGQTSALQSPAHTYADAGSYGATLTVTDNSGAHSSSSVSVAVSAAILPLVASAAGSPASGTAPLAVSFAGSAQGGVSPYSYRWSFGDGQTSTLRSPAHNYANPGTYIAVLTVTDNSGAQCSSSVSVAVSAAILPLVASAVGSPVSGMAPLAVSFAGSAQGGVSPYSYQWSFGDGQISSLQSPAHSYANPGTYIAVLTVTDNSGAHGSSSVSVAVSAAILPLVASAVSSPISNTSPLAVSFAGSAQGGVSPYSYSWNFGDGQISSLQSPVHNYANPGTYIAVLTVTDSLGNTASKSVAISARSVQTDTGLSQKKPKRVRRPIR